jgi:hypothetical protein
MKEWAPGWTIGGLVFDSRRVWDFSLHHSVQNVSGPTHPPNQWVPEALFLGVKRPGSETDQSPSSSAKVRGWWS